MSRHRIEELKRDRASLIAHGHDLLGRVVARSVGAPELVELDIELLEYVALYVEAVQSHLKPRGMCVTEDRLSLERAALSRRAPDIVKRVGILAEYAGSDPMWHELIDFFTLLAEHFEHQQAFFGADTLPPPPGEDTLAEVIHLFPPEEDGRYGA